ncbi:MAG: radical SAM protein [Colwellia sp.]|nr:radical SAM protein [Colwellia sp.]
MRPLVDMDTIQIEITNHCHKRCSNCTRLCGHHPSPYFMGLDYFKKAVDTMVDYPNMTGIMGGEPLMHPQFEEMCEYLHSKIKPDQCGLWTCFPKGKEHYREIVAKTFGHIFLNDQSRSDILHGPILVASEEITTLTEFEKWYLINECWVQKYWSASITPHGAFFCEIAAALSSLFDDAKPIQAWDIESRWWEKIPKDFKEQMEKYCVKCGAAMPLKKRESVDGRDDISPGMLDKLKDVSPKLKQDKYIKHNLQLERDNRQSATYKDFDYRNDIAARYGMFLTINARRFWTPHLKSDWEK